jgi:hypothetical protein
MTVYRTYQTESAPWNQLCGTNTGMACLGSSSGPPKSCTSDSGVRRRRWLVHQDRRHASSPSGWPCRDQTGSDGNNPQVSKPALYWNNKYGSEFVNPVVWGQHDLELSAARQGLLLRQQQHADQLQWPVGGATPPYAYPHPLTGGRAPPFAAQGL